METSRIFVKNLPPTLTDADFRNHFAGNGRHVTDAKLIRARRIGYVGYKTPQDAADAVRYFDRSFIRMSKLSVQLAKPFTDPSLRPRRRGVRQTNDTPDSPPGDADLPAPEKEENAKKRKRADIDESDPKLREFLETYQPSSRRRKEGDLEAGAADEAQPMAIPEDASDDEYEAIPKRLSTKQPTVVEKPAPVAPQQPSVDIPEPPGDEDLPEMEDPPEAKRAVDASDDEWLRSRTNRLLDILDPDEAAEQGANVETNPMPIVTEPGDQPDETAAAPMKETTRPNQKSDQEQITETCRLFVRNLSYSTSEDELREYFETFGALDEVHLPLDASGTSKGYAFVQFTQGSSALEAFQNSDGRTLQGRILHVLPGTAKKESKLDEFAISKLPLKKQNLIRKKAEAASHSFNWNSLFMSQDDVNSSTAARLGVSKSDLLDPTSTDAAVKQAIAETSIIQETKLYFAENGVNLDAFKSRKRGGSSILVKQFGYGTTMEELRKMFEEYGPVLRVLMPPSGTIALIQFAQTAHAQTAFARLAYRRVKGSVMLLEKAPQDLFGNHQGAPQPAARETGVQKLSGAQFLEQDERVDASSLFVRNLNFSTTSEQLADAFRAQKGFVSAQVKTKLDAKKPGQVLSMGFGFVHFRSKQEAIAAQEVMDGANLDGHTLTVKASHRGLDAAEEQRRADQAKKSASRGTKVVIKNLPFEASKKDVRALLETYGRCRVVRIPKKFGNSSRGFAFAEFTTPQEAANAISALKDTHLLGRRLVIDYAEEEVVDPEEEIAKMQKKIGGQMEKVTLQQLTGRNRKKFNIGEDDAEA